MKLSEAIRLGSMLHPQNFGSGRRYRNMRGQFSTPAHGMVDATCALMAADEAGYWNIFANEHCETVCPVCAYANALPQMIAHLNDEHRWTREAIADWVETVEPATPLEAPRVSADLVDAFPLDEVPVSCPRAKASS